MMKTLYGLLMGFALFLIVSPLAAQTNSEFDKYHTNKEIQQMLKKFKGKNIALHTIAESPGGEPITVLEIGANLEDVPAIFIGANFEGNIPLASEGALYFAQMLLDSSSYTENIKWYILPQPNPDAAAGFFAQIKSGRNVNDFVINDDADNATNEDEYEDLNGDGYITQMRVKDVEGEYITSPTNSLFLQKANTQKGERGVYKLYSEGIDNDKDGKFNEDGIGGINVGIAFPHLFPRSKSAAGMYTGQTPEVYGIMRFIYDRPEIAMAYTLGSSNFCLVPPQGGRKGDANLESIKLSGRNARMLNADASKKYSMNEVMELFKTASPTGTDVSPSIVARRLSLGAAVNPLAEDLTFYNQFSEEYKSFLDNKNFSTNTLDPAAAKDGSFELWAYYHLGIPSFSMNLFSIPKLAGKEDDQANNVEKGKKEKKKKPAFEKEEALLAYSENEWNGEGFVQWKTVNHPTLGRVEVGGFTPYLESTPKPEKIVSLAANQLPWFLQLSTNLPQLTIESKKATQMGTGIYKIEVIVANNGALSYPISMGERNNQPAPVIIVLDGDFEILDGKNRTPLGTLKANQLKKLSWLVKTNGKAMQASVRLESVVFTDEVQQINIGG